jgi:hypothetical protein
VTLAQDLAALPEDLQQNPLVRLDEDILAASEFISPLPEEVKAKYIRLWKQIRVEEIT